FEHEPRQFGRIHVWQRPADELEHVLDAVLALAAFIGLLRREVDAAARNVHVLGELLAQLVLGRYSRDLGAVALKLREVGRRAHALGAGHSDWFSRLRLEVEVPGYAVDRGRAAGDDRHVVWTGEARNDALGARAEPRLHEASDVGYDSVFKCPIEVRGITAVVANDNDRPVRPAIAHAVEANLRTRGGCHFGTLGRLVCSHKSLRPASVTSCPSGWAQYPASSFAEHAHGAIIPSSIRHQSILAARLHELPQNEGVPDQARRSLHLRQRA